MNWMKSLLAGSQPVSFSLEVLWSINTLLVISFLHIYKSGNKALKWIHIATSFSTLFRYTVSSPHITLILMSLCCRYKRPRHIWQISCSAKVIINHPSDNPGFKNWLVSMSPWQKKKKKKLLPILHILSRTSQWYPAENSFTFHLHFEIFI